MEPHSLESQGSIPVLTPVLLTVIGAVVKHEGEIVLGLCHLEHSAVGYGDAEVSGPGGVVIHLDAVHHSGFFVAAVYTKDIAVNTVVEGS